MSIFCALKVLGSVIIAASIPMIWISKKSKKVLLTNEDDFSESEDDTELNNDEIDLPIFPGCPISLNVSMFSCLLFMTRHKLTNVALEDLFLLLTAHIPNDYKPKMPLYLLKKYF